MTGYRKVLGSIPSRVEAFLFSQKNYFKKIEFFVNNMSTKNAYVIIFLDFYKMWTALQKSIMSKIGGFNGTRRWKCMISSFCCRRYSFNRWYTRIHNNFLDNLLILLSLYWVSVRWLCKFCFSHFLVEVVIEKMWKIELRFI